MQKSLYLGSYAGIPVRVHWTFGFLLLFIIIIVRRDQLDLAQGFGLFLYLMALFICVILHEFGHALTAKSYNINTKDIILSPIGGLARMENFPDAPKKELLIALAGPFVNLVLAFIAFCYLWLTGSNANPPTDLLNFYLSLEDFLKLFTVMNLVLFLFNLIPAFPMDGGRVLRAILSIKFGKLTATKIASYIGQSLAVGFFVLGFYHQQMVLPIIALFIFFVAANERKQVILQNKLSVTAAKDIMITGFEKIYTSDLFSKVLASYPSSKEKSFLVFNDEEELVGTLPELFIEDFRKSGVSDQPVKLLMHSKYHISDESINLEEVYTKLQSLGLSVLALSSENGLSGIIDRHLLKKWMLNK